jgi:hypothetical protein
MKALALLVAAAALLPAARPVLSVTPGSAAPGNTVAARLQNAKVANGRLALLAPDGTRTTMRPAGRAGPRSLGAWVPNVLPGVYRVQLLRRGRVVATARGGLGVREPRPAQRGCEESVYGELPAGWERSAVRAGPLALAGAGAAPEPRRKGAGYEPIKLVLVLENGVEATLRVAAEDRGHVALLYARSGVLGSFARGVRIADGLPAVTLTACAPSEAPHTQFNGGLVVAGPRCAHLEVHEKGLAEPYPLRVAFGRPC